MDMEVEVVGVSVGDLDRSIEFYETSSVSCSTTVPHRMERCATRN